jgi:hypothetical protein
MERECEVMEELTFGFCSVRCLGFVLLDGLIFSRASHMIRTFVPLKM